MANLTWSPDGYNTTFNDDVSSMCLVESWLDSCRMNGCSWHMQQGPLINDHIYADGSLLAWFVVCPLLGTCSRTIYATSTEFLALVKGPHVNGRNAAWRWTANVLSVTSMTLISSTDSTATNVPLLSVAGPPWTAISSGSMVISSMQVTQALTLYTMALSNHDPAMSWY